MLKNDIKLSFWQNYPQQGGELFYDSRIPKKAEEATEDFTGCSPNTWQQLGALIQ